MILLDTTVLVYAAGGDHTLQAPCRRILTAHRDGLIQAATTVEVVQEFAHVRARRRSRVDAVRVARAYARAFPLLVVAADDLDRGLAIFERQPALGAFDSVLAAVALNRGAEALISADRGFGQVAGLRWVDPATPALDMLISPAQPVPAAGPAVGPARDRLPKNVLIPRSIKITPAPWPTSTSRPARSSGALDPTTMAR